MSAAAVQTMQTAASPAEKITEEWGKFSLYNDCLDSYVEEAIVDVLKISSRSGKLLSAPITSVSNATWQAKDELQKDPFNMRKINDLSYMYWKEGQHDQCLNVLMRGWKRAGEIPDPSVKFRFLMKTSELSLGLWKFRQALAVFRDMQEPADAKQLRCYLILGVQVWSNNGDLQQALRLFQRAIEGESAAMATRILAVVVTDLKKAGGYEAAKCSLENTLQMARGSNTELAMIDQFVEGLANRKKIVKPEDVKRQVILGSIAVSSVLLFFFLYWLESKSLAAMAK